MKFFTARLFEKHFERSLPDHLSPLYLLLLTDAFERKFLAQRMVNDIGKDHRYVGVNALLEEIVSPSLFSHRSVCICDNIEKYRENTLPIPSDLTLILMGKSEPLFMQKVKKEVVVVNLIQEKPWERKKRLRRWLLENAHSKGRKLKDEAVDYLLQFYHADFSLLLQELEKVITYAGSENPLSLEVFQKVLSPAPTQTGWQLSEALVWGGDVNLLSIKELNNYHALVNQLRYQLHMGLTLAVGGVPPKLSPKWHAKFKPLALSYSSSYFLRGLKYLFTLEHRMRTISNHACLFEWFYAKLREEHHALPPT